MKIDFVWWKCHSAHTNLLHHLLLFLLDGTQQVRIVQMFTQPLFDPSYGGDVQVVAKHVILPLVETHKLQMILGSGTTKENELLRTLLLSKSDHRFDWTLFNEVAHNLSLLNATIDGYSYIGSIGYCRPVLSEEDTGCSGVRPALLYRMFDSCTSKLVAHAPLDASGESYE